MTYTAMDFSKILGMKGFSDTLLNNHFTLYQGYIKNTNKLTETIDGLVKAGKSDAPEYAELRRRFGFEWDGMRLHELYFGNLGGNGMPMTNSTGCWRRKPAKRNSSRPSAATMPGKRISVPPAPCEA